MSRTTSPKRAVFARHCNPWSAWTKWAHSPLMLVPVWRRSWRDTALAGAWMAVNATAAVAGIGAMLMVRYHDRHGGVR